MCSSSQVFLSDGSEVIFKNLSPDVFQQKTKLQSLEGSIYNFLSEELSNKETQQEILQQFPNQKIHRRNTGYAVGRITEATAF
jgi:hypothetical protein